MHLLSHYLNYCQACLLHIKTHAENLLYELGDDAPTHALFRTLALQTMHERSKLWQAEVDWIGQLQELLAT
jgi:hypothetical protein